MPATVVIRGAGDLASGVGLRLFRTGVNVVMTELADPLAVRRTVSFAEAVYAGSVEVEGVTAKRVLDPSDLPAIHNAIAAHQIPVVIDPACAAARLLRPVAIVDARMPKKPPEPLPHAALLYIGLGPGFVAAENCDAVIETERGHSMGRVIWKGGARADTMQPEGDGRRVLRAPTDGIFHSSAQIGQHFEAGEIIASVAGQEIAAPFAGTLRGLLRPGLHTHKGMKIGDIDAREDPAVCALVSDKALAVGGGVLEAMLTRPEVRAQIWN